MLRFFAKHLLPLLCLVLLFCVSPTPASAAKNLTIGSADRFLNSVVEPTGLEKNDVATTSGVIIKGLLQAVGTAFLILMVYGGFLWMTARGDESQVDKARKTIISAVIGIAIVVSAFGITVLVTERLVNNTKGPGTVGGGGAVGDQVLGCCIIDTGAAHACVTTTEVGCQAKVNDLDEMEPERSHPSQFIPNIDAVACDRMCENL